MAEISQPAVPTGDAATLLHSELNEITPSSADVDPAAETVSLDLAVASSPSLSASCVAPVYSSSNSVSCRQLPTTTGVAVTSGSPRALMASCSSTPPTPQSHGSENSPRLHSDAAVAVPPPPYSAHGASADLSAVLAVPAADSLAPTDAARSHLPPPPKKPLTPYMRFSKSVSDVFSVARLVSAGLKNSRPDLHFLPHSLEPHFSPLESEGVCFYQCWFVCLSVCVSVVFRYDR